MTTHRRTFEIERSSVDVEAGTFRAVVFTDGEASDGHILNIAGGDIPATMPLFVNHQADPRTQLGSLHLDKRSAHQVIMRGEVFLGGEGPEALVRRDILAKMAAGHVSRFSGRWDASEGDVVRRTELDSGHPAHVNAKKAQSDFKYRYGCFFDKWMAQEGSVVGLNSDRQATLRWATDETLPEPVRSFWRGQAEAPLDEEMPDPLAFEECEEYLAAVVPALMRCGSRRSPSIETARLMWDRAHLEAEDTDEPAPVVVVEGDDTEREVVAVADEAEAEAEAEATLRWAEDEAERSRSVTPRQVLRDLVEQGVDVAAILVSLADEQDPIEQVRQELREEMAELRAELETFRAGFDQATAASTGFDTRSFIEQVRTESDAARARTLEQVRAFLDERRGKVTNDEARRSAARELRELLEAQRANGRVPGDPSTPPGGALDDLLAGFAD